MQAKNTYVAKLKLTYCIFEFSAILLTFIFLARKRAGVIFLEFLKEVAKTHIAFNNS